MKNVVEELTYLKSELLEEARKLEKDADFTDDTPWSEHLLSVAEGLRRAADKIEKRILEHEKKIKRKTR